MPQGRKKIPFSGKAKKAQLQAKKQKKMLDVSGVHRPQNDDPATSDRSEIVKLNEQPSARGGSAVNRYALQFHRETEAEIRERKEAARKTIAPVPPSGLEISIENYFTKELDFPKRPPWNFDMSRDEFEARENRYFREYVSGLEQKFGWKELSYFELNLETWRQLWRVLEMSDIILIITDIRYCALMFPPSVYEYVTKTLHKEMIIVLNKIDLAPAPLVVAWKHYFKEKYPDLHILSFTSYPSYNLRGNQENKAGLQIRRRKGKIRMAAEGAKTLLEACKSIVKDEVDLSSWHNKIIEEMESEFDGDEDVEVGEIVELKKVDTSYVEHEKFRDGTLTIGCIGQPNVGKSSLMNAIMGKKVVSVSRTPGHTKHFQTIYLTPNVRLCDCPGLVFPSKVPKTLQVLMGSFPIAQLREPYSSIRYLAERLDLPRLLNLQHPENDEEWSAIDICDGWALKRRFYTARAARLDTYRAANNLLRMALEGKICLCLHPPAFTSKKEFWENHPDVQTVKWIQAKKGDDIQEFVYESSEGEEEEEDRAKVHERDDEPSSKEDEEKDTNEGSDSEDSDDAELGTANKFAALVTD